MSTFGQVPEGRIASVITQKWKTICDLSDCDKQQVEQTAMYCPQMWQLSCEYVPRPYLDCRGCFTRHEPTPLTHLPCVQTLSFMEHQPVVILQDTGSEQSLILEEFLPFLQNSYTVSDVLIVVLRWCDHVPIQQGHKV